MALIIVIWAVGLLSAMAASLAWSSTVSSRLATHSMDSAVIDTLAEVAVNRVVLSLLDPRPEERWRRDGVPRSFEFSGSQMTISVQDEIGRIDLNHADVRLLSDLLRSSGLAAQQAESLAGKIIDWRRNSSVTHRTNVSTTNIALAKADYLPRGGPFQSVDELLLVRGMTPDLFQRVQPALTVFSGRALIDPTVAPREALLALPGMTAEKADAIIQGRRNQSGPVLGETIPLQGRAFTIHVEVPRPAEQAVREAVVRLTGKTPHPYWALSWRAR